MQSQMSVFSVEMKTRHAAKATTSVFVEAFATRSSISAKHVGVISSYVVKTLDVMMVSSVILEFASMYPHLRDIIQKRSFAFTHTHAM